MGRRSSSTRAADAQAFGIAAIHQEPLIFPDLNVAENIFTGQHGRGAWINWSALHREAEEPSRRA